ncbi:Hexapeptide repeat of succinyl-transferase [Loktanella atrilutea]|uniref:Hexapeptide repeat of succinyl-transferase n=1 Tax=Loktanella atrilutea TaxID=366533 RepID=A0A1M5F3T6_LOKAT|nr:acyltransferase [Loktanella atrilutea]SHF86187.1 Hexapeptide repeat of succinyl-transferase [Loktanella atrilutea]
MIKSLNKLRWLRRILVGARRGYLRRVWNIDIHPTADMSLSAKFDLTNPRGIHIGAYSYIAFNARILTHDMTRNIRRDTYVGENCFIGGQSLILPGVKIGNGCVVGAGSVVTKSMPDNCIVAGNPAVILHRDVAVLSYGRIDPAWSRARAAEAAMAEAAAGTDGEKTEAE